MNGAEAALKTAAAAGVDVCFANPGTTEMEMVAALDNVPEIRGVLALFEGVATGAADGYGRITGKPALTLLHLGPGFANGIANLHNARRAHTPIVNLIGDHATWHRAADAPLASDIESLASPVSRVVTAKSAGSISRDMIAALSLASGPPSGPASLIVPQDAAWSDAPSTLATPEPRASEVDAEAIERAVTELRQGAALLLGGRVTHEVSALADRIRAATGCRVLTDSFCATVDGGQGRPTFEAIAYFPEQAIDQLQGISSIVLAGTRAPVSFFGYPSIPRSTMLPEDCQLTTIAPPAHSAAPALTAVVDALEAPATTVPGVPMAEVPTGDLSIRTFGAMVAALIPEGAIVINEAATSGIGWTTSSPGARPYTAFALTGGAIGMGMPSAVGAAVAAPDRKVVALQADGSGMYTLQALWTMARESLDITVLLCANRVYRILQIEMGRAGNNDPGPIAKSMTDLGSPAIDWVSLAKGMGVPATLATTLDELRAGLENGLNTPGPSFIEVLL